MAELTFSQGGKALALDRSRILAMLAARLPDDLRPAFQAAANDTEEALERFLEEKRDELIQRLPEEARFLVAKLKDFDEQSFDLPELAKETGAGAGRLTVRADASLLLDRLEPADLQGEVGFALDDDEALLKLEASGHLDGAAELKGAAGVLSLGLNFHGGTGQSIAYYFTADRRALVATIVPRLADLVVHPGRLADVVEALDGRGLVRVERTGESTVNLGLTISVSEQIKEVIGGLPAVGGAGGSLSLEYQDGATFSLVVDRSAASRYVVDFRKTRRKTRSSVLKLGVDVRIVGFRNRLIEQIARAIPEDTALTALLERLDALTEELSEEALRKELAKTLKSKWPKAKGAIGFLVGEETAKELAAEIQGELQQKIEETINARIDLLNTKTDTAARTVAQGVVDELGLGGEHAEALEAYVGEAVERAVEAFQGRLEGAVAALIDETDVERLLRPWAFVGDAVSEAIAALSSQAGDAVQRTQAALTEVHARYTHFRQGVLTAVREKMEEELSISIISEKERTLTNTRTVRFEFRQVDKAAENLYRALWTGDLGNFRALVEAAKASPSMVGLTGEYVSVASRLAESALDANLFGLGLGTAELFSDTVEVGIDLNGRLVVAKSGAELEKRRRRHGESQVVNATWRVDYLRSEVLDPPLFVKVVLTDDKFESGGEVEDFFGPLEDVGAMRAGIAEDVETTLFSSTVKKIRNATLTINVLLRWREWLELVGSDLKAQPMPNAWQPDSVCRQFLRDVETLAPVYVSAAHEAMKRRRETDLFAFLLEFGGIHNRGDAARYIGESPRGTSRVLNPSWRLARALADLDSGLVALQANWKTLVAKLARLETVDEGDLEDLRLEIQAVNNAFAHTFGDVLTTGLRFDDPGKNAWLTAATLNLFRTRSASPNPFLSCTFESERTGRLLFS
jgi:hypothetical protein